MALVCLAVVPAAEGFPTGYVPFTVVWPVCKCRPATPLPTHSVFSFIEFSHFGGYGVFHRGFVAFPCGHRRRRTLCVLIDHLESCLVKYLLVCFAYFSFRLSAFFPPVICRNYLYIVNIRPLLGVCVAGSLLFCGFCLFCRLHLLINQCS